MRAGLETGARLTAVLRQDVAPFDAPRGAAALQPEVCCQCPWHPPLVLALQKPTGQSSEDEWSRHLSHR